MQGLFTVGLITMALFSVMQCTNAWAQIVVLVQFILDFGLHVLISILSWTISLLHRFYKRSRPANTIVKRPLFTPRDALDLLTRVHHLFLPDQWAMPLPDQIMHVQAALQRTATRAEAQDKQLRHLRLELERSRRVTLDQRALADSLRHELQHQKHLVDTAMSRISAMKSQNTGLASRVMAQNRRVFTLLQQVQKLEREKVGHRAIMREVKCIKTLMTDGLEGKRENGTCRTATTKRRGISSPEDGSYPSSTVKTTPTPSDVYLRTHLQDAQGYGYVPRPDPPTHPPSVTGETWTLLLRRDRPFERPRRRSAFASVS